jgi:hypothetical protein
MNQFKKSFLGILIPVLCCLLLPTLANAQVYNMQVDADQNQFLPTENIAIISDRLSGEQVWENIFLSVGGKELIYNLDANKKSLEVSFYAKKSGNYNYTVSGISYHSDGYKYKSKGSGTIYIKAGTTTRFTLYGDFDKTNKKIRIYLQEGK